MRLNIWGPDQVSWRILAPHGGVAVYQGIKARATAAGTRPPTTEQQEMTIN